MKPAYFGQCSCCLNIDENNFPEETELDTNPSLTLARTLTLSTGERILAILSLLRHHDFKFHVHEFANKSGEGSRV